MKLYEKLLTIQKSIDYLKKNQNGHQYRYVDGTLTLGTIRPMMNEHGLLLKQEIVSTEHETITYSTRNGEKTEVLAKVKFRFTWVDVETGETDINEWAADGMNGFDKGIGSAMTYAERYFLLKYFHIPTDELDNDALGEKAGNKAPEPPHKKDPEFPPPHANDDDNCVLIRKASSLAELKAVWEKIPTDEKTEAVWDCKEVTKKKLK